ncbi:MAG TPA: hypothetical protein DD735_01130 [Clostridiales bacterium]|jgi:hypothetical protein|nr:hypothetical protein [Clostridiales bacterium]HCG34723.1 hypothetical protein [Clostridiales bacterium]
MIFSAVLGNARHPEYGVATIPFPIKREDYDSVLELLRPLEIGDALTRDCKIDEMAGNYPVLKCIEGTTVNLDELDYLAKRLDSFDDYEATQFQGMASRLNLCGVDELINLTFCSQQVTVITDFNDLDRLGRSHYLTMQGGCASVDELNRIDGSKIARELIDYEVGRVTPFGVVYDNGMELAQLYTGRNFPEYCYEASLLEVEMTHAAEPEDTKNTAYFLLPMAQAQIERTMHRAGVDIYADMRLRFQGSCLPEEIDAALDMENETLTSLNEMCAELSELSPADITKLAAVVSLAKPETAEQIKNLAGQLDLFDFVPNVQTSADYGRYMIQESGRFDYDESLSEYYDFAKYGEQRMAQEDGEFNCRGYVAYHGFVSMDEVMGGVSSERLDFQMGGME